MCRKPFPKEANKPKDIFDCVTTDVCGPVHITAYDRSKYFITFTDTFSKYTEIYFLKERSEVPDAIEKFIEKIKNVVNKKPKQLRSDRAKEYLSERVQKYLSQQGIEFKCTAQKSNVDGRS